MNNRGSEHQFRNYFRYFFELSIGNSCRYLLTIRKYRVTLGLQCSRNNRIGLNFNRIFETVSGRHGPNLWLCISRKKLRKLAVSGNSHCKYSTLLPTKIGNNITFPAKGASSSHPKPQPKMRVEENSCVSRMQHSTILI